MSKPKVYVFRDGVMGKPTCYAITPQGQIIVKAIGVVENDIVSSVKVKGFEPVSCGRWDTVVIDALILAQKKVHRTLHHQFVR